MRDAEPCARSGGAGSGGAGSGGDGFAFEEVLGWCEDCGRPLAASDPADPDAGPGDPPKQCPHCLRPYDPDRPASFRHAPPPAPPPWWREREALWGYAALASVLGGRVVLNVVGDPFFSAVSGGGGGPYSAATLVTGAAAVLAVLLGVGLVIPWIFVTVYLVLLGTEHLGEGLPVTVGVGASAGAVLFLGFPPPWLLAGAVLGAFAGLVRRWRELR